MEENRERGEINGEEVKTYWEEVGDKTEGGVLWIEEHTGGNKEIFNKKSQRKDGK